MNPPPEPFLRSLPRDLVSGLVVFLVALPLCLGIAHGSKAVGLDDARNVPIFAGLIAGVVGGVLVGLMSGSHTSVSGPAAGLTAVVAAQVLVLGSFQTFLLALVLAGVFQIVLGTLRAGFLARYVPSSVIAGLLAAIGVILILKQVPHLVGHDKVPEGDFAFSQFDQQNTFTELFDTFDDFRPGALLIGVFSLALLVVWERVPVLKKSLVLAPLVVVVWGVALNEFFIWLTNQFSIPLAVTGSSHLVDVKFDGAADLFTAGVFTPPDWGQWARGGVWVSALVIAAVASLETLLNLEAVDKLDPKRRDTPSSRELIAQGIGNVVCGLIGGLPVTAVVVRSSVNINAGARSKLSTVWHGLLLGGCVLFAAAALNRIPLSCLAAVLIVTGFKLVGPKLIKRMWAGGWEQFVPFAVTVLAIVFTDLLVGVLIGLGVSVAFVLRSNVRRPLDKVVEEHIGGPVVRINLANQVTFLNRAALTQALADVPDGGHVLLDATGTDYIDPDIADLIREFRTTTAPAHGVQVSLKGFQDRYPQLADRTLFTDYTSREVQSSLNPAQVLQLLKDGNERFRTGRRITRDLGRQVAATAAGQHPMAVFLTCIDSRSPAELLFDLGLGDVFVIRIAGNVCGVKVLGSMEFATAVAGAKLVVVLGHTKCGAVKAAVELTATGQGTPSDLKHLTPILDQVRVSALPLVDGGFTSRSAAEKGKVVDDVARQNVVKTVQEITAISDTVRRLADAGTIAVVGAMYDVTTGEVEFLNDVPPPKE